MREQRRVVAAGRRLRAEDLDHADDGSHQAEQRRGGGDRAERVQIALEPVHRGSPGRFECRAQAGFGDARLGDDRAQSRGKDGAEHGVGVKLVDDVGSRKVRARHGDHFIEQPRRRDAGRAQTRESFDDQCQGGNRADEQRPDRPTGGLYDRKQYGPFRRAKAAMPHRSLELWRPVDGHRNAVALACDIHDRSRVLRCKPDARPTSVDNFVDNSPPGRSSRVISGSAAPIAQKNGMTFLFEINDIGQNVAALRGQFGPQRQCRRGCGVVNSRGAVFCRWVSFPRAGLRAASGASARSCTRSRRWSSTTFPRAP